MAVSVVDMGVSYHIWGGPSRGRVRFSLTLPPTTTMLGDHLRIGAGAGSLAAALLVAPVDAVGGCEERVPDGAQFLRVVHALQFLGEHPAQSARHSGTRVGADHQVLRDALGDEAPCVVAVFDAGVVGAPEHLAVGGQAILVHQGQATDESAEERIDAGQTEHGGDSLKEVVSVRGTRLLLTHLSTLSAPSPVDGAENLTFGRLLRLRNIEKSGCQVLDRNIFEIFTILTQSDNNYQHGPLRAVLIVA